MSFRQFLTEKRDYIDDKEELVSRIEKECKEALKRFRKGEILYRGMDGSNSNAGKKDIRTDRKPLSSSPFEHIVFESMLKALGLPSREKSLFASTISTNVQDYGETYVILPTDKFTWYYFPEIQDMTLNFPDSMGLFTPKTQKAMGPELMKMKKIDDFKDIFLKYVELDDNYERALTADPRHKKEDLMAMFERKIDMWINEYRKPVTKGSMLDSGGNEIVIQGKSYYYFLDGYLGPYGKTMLD